MSTASVFASLIESFPQLARVSLYLFYSYLTLGSRVRKTRKAFEKQLVAAGMSKEDAERLSACFLDLKNSVTSMLKQGISRNQSDFVRIEGSRVLGFRLPISDRERETLGDAEDS